MSETKNLSEQLAERVVKKLVQAGLLRPERTQPTIAQIAGGKMKPDSWRLDIELAIDQSRRG